MRRDGACCAGRCSRRGCLERVLRRGEAGDEQQTQTANGATSEGSGAVRAQVSATSRRISDFFSQARAEARGGASGVKAGSLTDHVAACGIRLSSQPSVLPGDPLSTEAGGIPNVGRAVSASKDGACSSFVQGVCISDRSSLTSSKRCRGWAGWMPIIIGNTNNGIPP